MATSPTLVRTEVVNYVKACASLLADNPGSHDEFMIASEGLQQKDGSYSDQELALVQDMLLRVSVKVSQ
jgi:hypothetical protein